jgi:glyoxylase-like metal-dependent hydrolase (beta-lactamase superfamily II)
MTPARELTDSATGIRGLHAGSTEALPFAPSLEIRAFLLERPNGNVLVYSTSVIERDLPRIEELGGISRHYLNHRHEAMFASDAVEAPLFVHEDDARQVEGSYEVGETFSERHLVDQDFEVIPTPGHTPGATAYLWDSGEGRLLFTGDSIYLDEGEWVAAVLPSSDRDAYIDSLELLRGLDFDVLVPWAATRGRQPYAETDSADAQRRIGAILERVRAGGDR